MNMKLKTIVLSLAALAAVAACKSQFETLLSSNDVDAKYKAAMDLFNNGKYLKAGQLFESMALLTDGTERDDTVRYYWALSNYRYKDFYTAESNFAKFIEKYPQRPFTSDARFMRIDCLYRATLRWELDQTPTRTCLATITEYLTEYPTDGPHVEACVEMINHYARMSVPAKQKERYLVFVDDYLNFIGENPESKYRRELDAMYRRSQRALGRYDGIDEELDLKAKDFERERKAIEKEKEGDKNN